MRITPIILVALGGWGLLYPAMLLELNAAEGRLVFLIILALGIFSLWRLKRRKF